MASDTSLVFNLIARDRASGQISAMREKLATASAGIGAGVAAALGVGVAANLDMGAANSKLAAQLGVGPAEAAKLSKVSASVYANAWGESTSDVNEAIKGVYQNIGNVDSAKGGLEGVTTKVMALAQTFDQDVGPSTVAVGQMIKTGLAKNADEALDILTRGFQSGANKADDLLDTMNEYGTQFHKFGLDGQTATGLLTQGLKSGARDADLVADAIKEFSIRAIDGSTTTAQGFKAIGLNAGQMAAQIGKGGSSANKALDLTLDKLRGIDDPVKREAAAVALFGTQAEDLGQSLFALDPSKAVQALGKVGGAADRMAKRVGNNPAAALESFKRKAILKLADITGTFVQFGMHNQGLMKGLGGALLVVAGAVMAVAVAQRIYATYTAISAAATTVLNSTLYRTVAGYLRLMAVGLMAYVRIAAGAVASAATTGAAWLGSALTSIGTWVAAVVRAAAVAVAQFVRMAARAIVWAATMAAQWLIAMGPVGWVIAAVVALVALIIANWSKVKAWTGKIWNWLWGHIKSIASKVWNFFLNWTIVGLIIKHWSAIKSGTVRVWNAVVGWVKGIPGRIVNFFLNWTLPGLIIKHWSRIKAGIVEKGTAALNWVRGLPGRIRAAIGNLGSLLYGAGQRIIQGLVNGIKNMAGNVKNAVSSVLSSARNLLPFSPAKEGPFSGKGWTLYSGQSMMTGLAQGIDSRRNRARQAMVSAMAYVRPRNADAGAADTFREVSSTGRDSTSQRPIQANITVDGRVLASVLIDPLRGQIQNISGGSVQKALGRGSA